MFSTTKTGTCTLPLCTPIVKPTMPGVITESRDQVLITVLSPSFNLDSLVSSFGSVNGPFLIERPIDYLVRRLTIRWREYFFGRRVRTPSACLPHGVFGYFIPIGLWP